MPDSAATETTAYATLALLTGGDNLNAGQAIRWLAGRRGAKGGFGSTQDTVVALQALRGAAVDVLIDALVLDEMPPYAVGLDQLKLLDAYLDRMILATAAAAW